MYESYYGFREKPFSLLPDPSFLFLSKQHNMALTMLQYGMMNHAGITVITGEVGSGKTTLVRQLLNEIGDDVTVGLISNTHQSFGELMQWVLRAFGLHYKDQDAINLYETFENFIVGEYAKGKRTILIIDEAQNMASSTLEELRMLTNINADKDQVLQLVLVGQPELKDTLSRPDLIQFVQRVVSSYHLGALSQDDAHEYIRHRLSKSGGDPGIFDEKSREAIWKASGGIPRLINHICDISLVYGFAEQRQIIREDLVNDVIKERQGSGVYFINESSDHENKADDPGKSETFIVTNNIAKDDDSLSGSEIIPDTIKTKHPDIAEESDNNAAQESTNKLRVAVASDSNEQRLTLKKILEDEGLDVSTVVPISERYLGQIDHKCADVLLIDLDESIEETPGGLDYLFDNLLAECSIPILFNDSSMQPGVSQVAVAGKNLAAKLNSLISGE